MASLFKACFKSELPDIEKMIEDAVEKKVALLIKKYLEKDLLETEDVTLESYPHDQIKNTST